MEDNFCQACNHYCRYYTIGRGKLIAIPSGHCLQVCVRNNMRKPDSPSCKHFSLRDSEKEKKSRNESFRDTITDMRAKLSEILRILSAEE